MSHRILFAIVVSVALCISTTMAQDFSDFQPKDFSDKIDAAVKTIKQKAVEGKFKPDWKSLEQYEIPDWYQDAKFGIFIHWGAYTVPEQGWEWYPRQMYLDKKTWRGNLYQYHQKTYGDQSKFGYKDFIPKFKAEKFDPSAWVKLFKKAGAKYVVPVAEHHDGFAMYQSDLTQWNSVDMGPKRDVVGEIKKATEAEGLRFGVSSHRAFNWLYYVRNENFDSADPRFAGLYGRPIPQLFKEDAWNYQKNWPAQDKEFKDEWLARTCELIERYDPELIWFDFGINNVNGRAPEKNPFAEHLKLFAAFFYNHGEEKSQKVVLNYKWTAYPEKTAVLDLERSKLDDIRELYWQTDTSVAKNTWSYVEKMNYRTADSLVDDLVDIVSKNGGLLLNVCPRADGSIPQEQQDLLMEIGGWLKINGEAIYGARPFKTYGEGPTETVTGHVSEGKNKPFGPKDIRFTTRRADGDAKKIEAIYAIALKPSAGKKLVVTKLGTSNSWGTKVTGVKLLGHDGELKWSQEANGLVVTLPAKLPSDYAVTLKVQ